MKPERWQHIEQIYHAALERDAEQRPAFLSQACGDDARLRDEVEGLLAANDSADDFLITPALEVEAKNLAAEQSTALLGVQIEQHLSHYQILKRIGAGGMGEVFLARDTILERRVALKLLPVKFTQDAERLQRFVREAKAASALNHPNIITIYEIGEIATALGKTHFIATEFIEGETLRSWTVDEEKRLRQVLDIAIQVASALDAAHKAGIVHRDIKPENVMVRPDGVVKVLDFGLAKLTTRSAENVDSQAQTLALAMTKPGMILGTLRYMSPEQARGRVVDARSDIFSLGVMLYELLTGEALFAGDTDADIIAAIIHKEAPPLTDSLPEVPQELEHIVLKALAKDLAARYQSAEEMREALRAVSAALPNPDSLPTRLMLFQPAAPRGWVMTTLSGVLQRPRVLTSMVVAIVVAALLLAAALMWRRNASHQPSPDALFWYDQGIKSLRNGAYYEASKRLQAAVEKDEKFALAHARLAEAWTEMDSPDKANQAMLRAQSLVEDLSPLPPLDGLYLQAITYMLVHQYATAIEKYLEITQAAPDAEKAYAYVELGRAYEKNDEIDKAIQSYQYALGFAPSEAAALLRLGILYGGRQQDLERALKSFQEAETSYQALSNDEGVIEVLYQRGFFFYNLDQPQEAKTQLEKALTMTQVSDNKYLYQRIKSLQVLSNVYAAERKAKQAEDYANDAIKLAREKGIDSQVTQGLIWLGNTFLMRSEYGDAEKNYKQALESAQSDHEPLNKAWAQLSLGSLRSLQGNKDEALNYLTQSRLFYEKGGYRKWLSLNLTLLARIYRDQGDHETALAIFSKQMELGKRVGDLSLVALAHEESGSVLAAQERFSEALQHFDEGYKINKSLKGLLNLGYTVAHRARMLWQVGRYKEARAALIEASSIAERPEGTDKRLLASIHLINARLELSNGNFQQAKLKSRQSLDLAGTQYKNSLVQAKYTLGLAQTRSGAPREGIRLCAEAVEIAKSMGDQHLLDSALLASAEAMFESGEAQRALETALHVQESFARFGQQDSEWRAWSIAARARRQLGEETAAREYAANANTLLSNLAQKLDPEAYKGYLSRPDVQHFHKQLGQLLNPKP